MKKNAIVILILILFLGLVFTPVVNSSVIHKKIEKKDTIIKNFILENDTIYVDDDNVDGPQDGSLEHPYKTIDDAMKYQYDGLAIFVFSGEYTENLVITRSINLTGEDKNSTIISEKEGYTKLIEIKSSYVHISGFTFKRRDKGVCGIYIKEKENSKRVKNNISDNIFSNFIQPAILLDGWYGPQHNIFTNNIIHGDLSIHGYARGNTISNNTFKKNSDVTIDVKNDGSILSNTVSNNRFEEESNIFMHGITMNNVFSNNYLKNGDIKISTSFDNTISNNNINGGKITIGTKEPRNEGNKNIIENNLIVNSDGIAIFNDYYDIIRNNTFRNSKGILVDGIYETHLTTHKIENNYIDGKLISYHCNEDGGSISSKDISTVILVNCKNFEIRNLEIRNGYGIMIISSSNIKIYENSILETSSPGLKILYSSNIIVHTNTFINNKNGIVLFSSSNSQIYNNNIYDESIGIKLLYSPSNHIYRNIIIKARSYGLYADCSDKGEIYENHFERNKVSLGLHFSSKNLIKKNNFIKSSDKDVEFQLNFNDKSGNKLIRNYYSKHESLKPNFIKGKLKTIFFRIIWNQMGPKIEYVWIKWYDVDWLPAKDSYSGSWMEGENQIKVTSPGSGDKWQVGTSHLIQWEYVEDLGEKITISLQKENNPGFIRGIEIADCVSNSQREYLWMMPSSISSGDNYHIVITGKDTTIVSDKFSITNDDDKDCDIAIYAPETNETWKTGSSYDVKWDYTGNIGKNVVITLHRINNTDFMEMIDTVPASDRKYEFKVPKELSWENDYFFIIWSETSDVYNMSGIFEIKEGKSKSMDGPRISINLLQKIFNYFTLIKQLQSSRCPLFNLFESLQPYLTYSQLQPS